jgi:hypothetical protein
MDNNMCCICFTKVFELHNKYICRHYDVCSECIERITFCPICKCDSYVGTRIYNVVDDKIKEFTQQLKNILTDKNINVLEISQCYDKNNLIRLFLSISLIWLILIDLFNLFGG